MRIMSPTLAIFTRLHIRAFTLPSHKISEDHGQNKEIHRLILAIIFHFFRPDGIRYLGTLGIPDPDPPIPGHLLCKSNGYNVIVQHKKSWLE